MGFFDYQNYDQASNSIRWGNGSTTQLFNAPLSYTGGAGGATTEDMNWADLVNPALASLGYTAPSAQQMSGDGGIDATAAQAQAEAAMQYLRSRYGDGPFAIGSTRLSGSDSQGGQSRRDLFQQQADGTWKPIDGSGYMFGDAGTKSDGIKVGTILASFLGAGYANGWGEAAGTGAAAGGADVATGNGAFLGEGVSSGVPAWDSAYTAAGGSLGAAGSAATPSGSTAGETAFQPEYNFDPNGMPSGSQYASDFAGTGLGGNMSATSGSWTQYIPAATQAFNALLQSYQSNKANEALQNAGNQANATQRYIFDTLRADQAPYRTAGYNALDNIGRLMRDPSSVANDPGYQFGLKEGLRSVDNSASARGGIGGAALRQGSRYAEDYATTKLNDVFNRNATVAGFGQVANNQGIATGTNYGNNVSNNQLWMGGAQAGNYMNQGNIYGNLLNQYGANYGRGGY